jgi:hypothetical protein
MGWLSGKKTAHQLSPTPLTLAKAQTVKRRVSLKPALSNLGGLFLFSTASEDAKGYDMNVKHEYRVRPVVRYIVTDYHTTTSDGGRGGSVGSRVIAECPNEETAEWVCNYLSRGAEVINQELFARGNQECSPPID